ncbi:MAG: 8-oxoguanine deaminase [Nocardioidaceae bacterium]
MSILVIDGCAIVTVDAARTEHEVGHVVIDGARIMSVAPGRSSHEHANATYVDATGCLATPGLVNTHHHLYQWATRGMAVDDTLFDWLTTLYPIWGSLDEEIVAAAAAAGLGWLAKTGCTTTTDHHYVFPSNGAGGGGDLLQATIHAAQRVGLRFLPTRGSMDLGQAEGGLPPDHVVESLDTILQATTEAIDRYHDPSPDSMLRVGVAPCSPFSATADLLRQSAGLARDRGVRLHTHLAETADEERFCRQTFDCSPVEYAESLGWLGGDVWLAHMVHLDDPSIARLADTRTAVAHCPSSNARLGSGICRTRDLRAAGVPVGLGVDGAASNEAASLREEMRQALLFARATGGPHAFTARDALELATFGGAKVLGWDDQLGSLETGKLADIALWRLDTLAHSDIADPVSALVLGPPAPLELLLVQGRPVVEQDRLVNLDQDAVAHQARAASHRLWTKARVIS